MTVSKQKYKKMVKDASDPSPKWRNQLLAFTIGGAVCAFSQLLFNLYSAAGVSENDAKTLVSVTLIGITAVLTALHLYEHYAKVAGAGSLVPITGFANSMVSPSIEFKPEGQVMGIGVKMFSVAGPVLVFGATAAAVYGVLLWITDLLAGVL